MTIRNNDAARAAFESVLIALDKLQACKSKVHAVFYGGAKPVVVVEKPPAFVRGGLTNRQVVNDTLQHTYAAPFNGVQLQWIECTPIVREAGHA